MPEERAVGAILQSGEARAHDTGHAAGRSVILALLSGIAGLWTTLLAVPSLHLSVSASRIRQSTATVLAGTLTASMARRHFAAYSGASFAEALALSEAAT
jgi:hypothetical protein